MDNETYQRIRQETLDRLNNFRSKHGLEDILPVAPSVFQTFESRLTDYDRMLLAGMKVTL